MPPETLIGSTLAGYRIEEEIGRGGMGVVYRAHDPELRRSVCLKLIAPELAADPSFRERFLREIEVAASLEHPHVCPVYRAGEEAGELYVAMRYLEGDSLAEKVAAEGPLTPERALSLLRQLASALDLSHARGLLHRDVKPENVLLDTSGNAYLVDFGLAGAIWQEEEASLFAGSLAYLAPERCQGEPALPASDLYALACLGYALLSGRPPFPREHEAALIYAHLREEPPSLQEQGLARLDPVLRQALAKDSAARHESCAAFADALALALAGPEPSSLETWPETLPRPVTRFLGRRQELAELAALLVDPDTRLLTLTGPGGTGKTRLALHAAAAAASAFAEGVRFCSLAPLRDPAHALSQIAGVLDVAEQPPTPLRDTLREALAGRELLLVLDNAEHLLPSFADDVSLLRDVPSGPTLLVTSRERLQLQAERLYPVSALADPDARALFSDRASFLDSAHDPEDPAIATLCARLDALPLALELAAARSDLYSPSELLRALEGQAELLTGARDHDPRHRTLQATIAWSYDLLSAAEQRSFRALSVFAGGCTAEAARAVADADTALLHSLVQKSLLRSRESERERRYFQLETIREYAAGLLTQANEAAGLRHTEYFCRLAIDSGPLLDTSGAVEAVAMLEGDSDNLRIALHRGLESSPQAVAEAVGALYRYWLHGNREREGHEIATLVLKTGGSAAGPLHGIVKTVVGTLAWDLGDWEAGERELNEAIALLRGTDSGYWLARALNNRGLLAVYRGQHAEAKNFYEESLELSSALGDERGSAMTLGNMAVISLEIGDFTSARNELQRTIELMRVVGSPSDIALGLYNLGCVELVDGDVGKASDLAQQAIELADADHSPRVVMESKILLARARIDMGLSEPARTLLIEVIESAFGDEYLWAMIMGLEGVAEYALRCADMVEEALLCLGASDQLRDELEMPLGVPDLVRRQGLFGSLDSRAVGHSLDEDLRRGRLLSSEVVRGLCSSVLSP